MAILTQAERDAAYQRVRQELGVDRIGRGPEAIPLPPRFQSGTAKRGKALPIEAEIYGAQMYEFEVWARPALDLRTRSFITVAALAAARAPNQLYRHINSALNLGITPDEIHEMLLHVSCYAGNPAWEEGVGVANEAFVARGVLPPGSGVAVELKPPMNHEERRLARERIVEALGVGRIGLGPNAPPLKPLPGGPILSSRPGTLDEEISFLGADYGYGELWGRAGLPMRIRSFITMSVLQVMLENHQLHIHIGNALNIGITREEVSEALAQTGVYHGTSGWHNAFTVARHVFEQHPAGGGKPN